MKTIRTPRAREAFLHAFRETANVTAACEAANIGRSAAYAWKREDDEFAQEWADADEAATDALEQVARDRAMSGESDRMLEILLKARRPEKYVERRHLEHTGEVAITRVELVAPDDDGTD